MTSSTEPFLREFFRQVRDQPIEPADPRYIQLYADREISGDDPVNLMGKTIEWTPGGSVQLLSGFRGAGKTTELRRLQQVLEMKGYIVIRIDVENYINMAVPVDISDFLMTVAGAFSDSAVDAGVLKNSGFEVDYWKRLENFLSGIKFSGVSMAVGIGVASIAVKSNLKNDPSFKKHLQEHMFSYLGALVNDIREFFEKCICNIQYHNCTQSEVVLLVDSIEHFRGTLINARDVQSSVETLFVSHAEKLHLPHLHVVYTVPPYLKIRYSNLGALYGPGSLHILPSLKLYDRKNNRIDAGFDAMERIVKARGNWGRLLGDRDALDDLIRFSGGHIRDLLRLLSEVLLRANTLPVSGSTVTAAIDQLRTEFLPIPDDDARWLAKIAQTHQSALSSIANLPELARLFDTHLALCYRNGEEWYDVHPLISEHIESKPWERAG